ncbi:MAG: hypothetical protein EOM50_07280 [Erysipelotrichia bacterium]|nr:hypothetical protein [Erysipelotrichia bacterium]
MIVSIHQPDYIPYLGYFYKIYQSEVFVFLDDVQFSNDNMHHWNRIKTPQGECRLKIPVEHSFGDNINQVRTKDELKWKEKHLKTIEMNYKKTEYFEEIYPNYKEVILSEYPNLSEMNIVINQFICKSFGINPKFVRSSDLNIDSAKEDRVIDICLALGGTTYISGNGARAYQVDEHYENKGIYLKYTDYKPFTYNQRWGEFIPNLSVLDYIFNCGFNNPFKLN